LYAPKRPAVDLTAGLLLLMAVGTVVVASLWSELTDPDQANESYSILAKVYQRIVVKHFCMLWFLQLTAFDILYT